MKFFNTHISIERLADKADGKEELSKDLEQHLKSCSHCSAEFARLHQVVGLMRGDNAMDAPPAALQFAQNIFRARRQFASQMTQGQKILGSLKIDLSAFTPAFGERSAAASDERQMLFAVGDYDIDLRIKRVENGFAVRGQILGELTEKCLVRLESSNFAHDVSIDNLGNFSFSPLSSVDDLQVSLIFIE
jgi:hypothetical protein